MIRTEWLFGLVAVVIASVAGVLEFRATSSTSLDLEPVIVTRASSEARPSPDPSMWKERLAIVDRAIERSELHRAIFEWHEAYGVALGSRRWDAMVAMGDRAVRISELTGDPTRFRAEARQAYLNALFRARAQRSAEGVSHVADAFERLGDAEVAQQARRLAEDLS
jgi:hypothetical protein